MAKLGYVNRKSNGTFVGRLQTLTLDVEIMLVPIDKTSTDAPDYRVVSGLAEVGAAWTKRSKATGSDYISISIDTPELPRRINATLGRAPGSEDPDTFSIIWNRPKAH
ncbi:DUF736 domain-containing protein [Brucella gallinifaecis]|uniref:DUF736 domain-containing protein n=1 Tax=Brucella gallinifaecis TaxID=215590 RepID=A0A502BI83_9HYPH|nr:DUF736 domain-containing protein [Brucella gallinifaecis]TPF73894.1 DUF736 domain-containing protein [Brucella gallinifaecis]